MQFYIQSPQSLKVFGLTVKKSVKDPNLTWPGRLLSVSTPVVMGNHYSGKEQGVARAGAWRFCSGSSTSLNISYLREEWRGYVTMGLKGHLQEWLFTLGLRRGY